jgi:hypothetical protein
MRIWPGAIALLLAPLWFPAAAEWRFAPRIALSGPPLAGVFHHLEGAGRRHIALSGSIIAAVWEDDSSGDPQIYLAYKATGASAFSAPLRLSDGIEAYQPAITALPRGGFVVAYEQDAQVFARIWTEQGPGPALRLSTSGVESAQPTLASDGNRVFAAWREKANRSYTLQVSELAPDNARNLQSLSRNPVEAAAQPRPMLMPTLALSPAGLAIAWEDRRAGHTRLLVSYSDPDSISFSAPGNLNEFYSNRNPYDKGNGVTRVTMTAMGEDEVIAAWMDKRRGGSGYGIFASMAAEGGAEFGPNEKVHGDQGDKLPHYNPAVAANSAGDFYVVWDDYRRGDSDIWLSGYNDDMEWDADFSPPPASGAGEQSHPAVWLDAAGGLHLLWVERAESLAPTRLFYSYGQRSD